MNGMKRWSIAGAVMAACLVACVHEDETPKPPGPQRGTREWILKEKADEKAAREELRRENEARWAANAARGAAKVEKQRADEVAAHEADCASDREERIARLANRFREIDRLTKLDAWAADHCKWEDRGTDVVRDVQLPTGQIVKRRIHQTDIVRKCDAKEPADLPSSPRERAIDSLPENRDAGRNWQCKDADDASGHPQPCGYVRCGNSAGVSGR